MHCAAACRGSPARYDIQQAGTSDTLGPEKGRPLRSSCKHDGCLGEYLLLWLCICKSTHARKHILRNEIQRSFNPSQTATDHSNTVACDQTQSKGRDGQAAAQGANL